MRIWKVRAIQCIIGYIQMCLIILSFKPISDWIDSLNWIHQINFFINSTLIMKMIFLPFVIVFCLLFVILIILYIFIPQYLIEKLED